MQTNSDDMTMDTVIGIDLGGTTIKGGLIRGHELVNQEVMETRADEGGRVSLEILKEVIRRLITADTKSIGIGVPSVVDCRKGIVYHVQNIRDWDEVHLKEILEKEFNLPIHINNDANCFAKGEKIYGQGRSFDNFVGITLGTGVGGGIIQRGELFYDANCGSGEYGEMPYLDGKLEDYCGSFFFSRFNSNGLEISQRAQDGDGVAVEILNQYAMHLSVLVRMIVLSVDPEAIIFGGAISGSFRLFEQKMREHLDDFAFPNSINRLKIIPSNLQNSSILGASALCF